MNVTDMATLYESALVAAVAGERVNEVPPLDTQTLPHERTLQLLLWCGVFGCEFCDDTSNRVQILDFGEWNKIAGPDFLNARVQIGERVLTGDVELDPTPESWEQHGHGANPQFEHVVLHLVCCAPQQEWFTRNAKHERVAMAIIPQERLAEARMMQPISNPVRYCKHAELLAAMSIEELGMLLQTAAAYRFCNKHKRYVARTRLAGAEQVLFEAVAESLGYHANKMTMRHLAMRAPIKAIRACPEAILFGTAGFLMPMLDERGSSQAVTYHKQLWQAWWQVRERFELGEERCFPWVFSGNRPANHPQRRAGALATIATKFDVFKQLCRVECVQELTKFLSTLTHPYWSNHVTLLSNPSPRNMALMGKDRITDFIVNHVLPAQGDETAWELYLLYKAGHVNAKVQAVSKSLLAERKDREQFLTLAWQHQALLQINEDLCSHHVCTLCALIDKMHERAFART